MTTQELQAKSEAAEANVKVLTFAQQIENVPLKLVQQGFRRHPSESVWYRWQETEGVKNPHWQMVRLPDGTKVSRPVYEIAKGVVVYAHAGWGEGLSPTVETVEVWKYWWCQWDKAIPVYIQPSQVGYFLVCQWMYGCMPLDRMDGTWAGPVLPLARTV